MRIKSLKFACLTWRSGFKRANLLIFSLREWTRRGATLRTWSDLDDLRRNLFAYDMLLSTFQSLDFVKRSHAYSRS